MEELANVVSAYPGATIIKREPRYLCARPLKFVEPFSCLLTTALTAISLLTQMCYPSCLLCAHSSHPASENGSLWYVSEPSHVLLGMPNFLIQLLALSMMWSFFSLLMHQS